MGITSSQPLYAIRDVPGKGKGLIATKDITKGTRIISETPIIAISSRYIADIRQLGARVHQELVGLPGEQQLEFYSMNNAYPYSSSLERLGGIFRTNALPMGEDLDTGGIFLNACRINHACDHNAVNFWNSNLGPKLPDGEDPGQLTILAARDIHKGEEITIFYLSSLRNRQARQEELEENFDFTCSCQLCTLPPEQCQESDAKLDRIHEIDDIIARGGMQEFVSSAHRFLGYVDEQVRIWSDTTPNIVGLSRAYPDAFQIAVANADAARARVFADRLLPLYQITLGEDSPDVIRYRELADPAEHDNYGISMKWKTSLDDIPQGLQPEEFEDWLWRRKTSPRKEGQRTSFYDREVFPSFNDLPNKTFPESEYFEYSQTDLENRRPVRHWCFFGEITEDMRSVLLLKDIDDREVPIIFDRNTRSNRLFTSDSQKGSTVAILYAVRHELTFGGLGITQKDPQMMKIFPLSLKRLQALSEKAQKLSRETEPLDTCHKCAKKSASLKRCGKCSSVWYCNRNCQKDDWTDVGHKAECKVLRDPDWKAMLQLEWDKFETEFHFPIRARSVP